MQRALLPLLAAALLATWLLNTGCRHAQPPSPAAHGHEHHAPHDGTLVVYGDEFAHLELVLDAAEGRLTAYALDGEAEKAVPIAAKQIDIDAQPPSGTLLKLHLRPVASPLTGETVGHTSQFEVQDAGLRGLTTFQGTVGPVTIKDAAQPATAFRFPGGNEDKEHEHEQR